VASFEALQGPPRKIPKRELASPPGRGRGEKGDRVLAIARLVGIGLSRSVQRHAPGGVSKR
jgi:hypothetical protein